MPVYQLPDDYLFPDPELAEPDGMLAVGGDLSVKRLITAYSLGIFPWYSPESPILWWSPDPRMVMYPENMKVTKSLKQVISSKKFEVKFDEDFESVIEYCSSVPRGKGNGTWIVEEMKEAYIKLHRAGFAHSVETYFEGELVGGLYGVSLGKAFFGESMFHLMTDASKVALYYLCEKLKRLDFKIIDVQQKTDHLARLGATEISRKKFLEILDDALKIDGHYGSWEDM